MKWYVPDNKTFLLFGFPFYQKDGIYRRLQLNPPKPLPVNVNMIANETAGGQIRFSACLKCLNLKVDLAEVRKRYWHLSDAAALGFDCYVRESDEYRYFSTTKIEPRSNRYEQAIIELDEPKTLDILINFPLYCGVDKVMIGIDDNAILFTPHSPVYDKKIVFYGSSIMQGACASRPGMNVSNILSRWLNIETINLGFDSSGKAEPEVAEAVREISDTALFVISVEGNCPDNEWLQNKVIEFISIYRDKQRKTPVLIMPFMPGPKEYILSSEREKRIIKKEIQRNIVHYYNQHGDNNVYFADSESFPFEIFEGHDISSEQTTDGLHLNDSGFLRKAKGLYPVIKKIIDQSNLEVRI